MLPEVGLVAGHARVSHGTSSTVGEGWISDGMQARSEQHDAESSTQEVRRSDRLRTSGERWARAEGRVEVGVLHDPLLDVRDNPQ